MGRVGARHTGQKDIRGDFAGFELDPAWVFGASLPPKSVILF